MLCFEGIFDDERYAGAKSFIDAYNAVYPLSRDDLVAAVISILQNSVFGIWAEREHYLKNNSRPDQFIISNLQKIKYLAKHHDEFIERITAFG